MGLISFDSPACYQENVFIKKASLLDLRKREEHLGRILAACWQKEVRGGYWQDLETDWVVFSQVGIMRSYDIIDWEWYAQRGKGLEANFYGQAVHLISQEQILPGTRS